LIISFLYDCSKASTHLGQKYHRGIALEVIPLAYVPTMTKVNKMFGGSVELRMAKNKAVCNKCTTWCV